MRVITALFIAALCALGVCQEAAPIPEEVSKFDNWVGTWTAKEKFYMPGAKEPMENEGVMTITKSLGGRYIEGRYSTEMMGQKMEGMHLMTYDPDRKKWIGYWFDSAAPGIMEMEGDLVGNKLTMVSKPVAIPGMADKQTFRATWDTKDKDNVLFLLELQTGNDWAKMIESEYKRKS